MKWLLIVDPLSALVDLFVNLIIISMSYIFWRPIYRSVNRMNINITIVV